jgi:hypothetical protein
MRSGVDLVAARRRVVPHPAVVLGSVVERDGAPLLVTELQSPVRVQSVCTHSFDGDRRRQPRCARADRLEVGTCPGDGYCGGAGDQGVIAGVLGFADHRPEGVPYGAEAR